MMLGRRPPTRCAGTRRRTSRLQLVRPRRHTRRSGGSPREQHAANGSARAATSSIGVADEDGEVSHWISANSVVVEATADGEPDVVAVSFTDITALVESTAELEQNEQRFRTLIAPLVRHRRGDRRRPADHLRRAARSRRSSATRTTSSSATTPSTLIHPEDLEETVAAVARTFDDSREPEPHELRLRHADGSWVVPRGARHRTSSTIPLIGGIAVNLRDISERRRIEATLHDAQVRFEEAFQHAPIGMAMIARGRPLLPREPRLLQDARLHRGASCSKSASPS